MQLPEKYRWLREMETLPRMVEVALSQLGVLETPGRASNAVILYWAKECGLSRIYSDDAVPWCGLFMTWVARTAGNPSPKDPLWALNWSRFAGAGGQPELGDVLVFKRGAGGHVGLYVEEDKSAFHVLGGNQSDRVSIDRIVKARLYAVRKPNYSTKQPTIIDEPE